MTRPRRPAANPLWGDDWSAVAANWRLEAGVRHLNHGAYGAVARPVRQAHASLLRRLDVNPTAWFRRGMRDELDAARRRAAEFVGAEPDRFALVRNTSTAITIVADGVHLRPGDEVLLTSMTFATTRRAFTNAAARAGATVTTAEIPVTNRAEEIVGALEAAVTERTRLIVADAVASPAAMVMPVDAIVAMAHRHGVQVFIDGAQAPGNVAVDLGRTRPDYWAGDFHKWVGASPGAAGLYVGGDPSALRPRIEGMREPTFPGSFAGEGVDDYSGMLTIPAAIDFLETLGPERVRDHNRALVAHGAAVIGAELRTAAVPCVFAGSARVVLPEGVGADASAARALEAGIAKDLRTEVTVAPGLMRISAAPYNAPAEYETFAADLAGYLGVG